MADILRHVLNGFEEILMRSWIAARARQYCDNAQEKYQKYAFRARQCHPNES